MQSYSAYTPYLDGLNASKYSSESGPQFVIFANHCVDRRYCFFDEAQTKNVLLSHFEVADRGDDMILLAKRPQPLTSTIVPLKDGRINFG